MARNKIQFQKGLSLNEFLKDYGTENQCFAALYTLRWPDGFRCPFCGHDQCCQLNYRRLQQCSGCQRQTSVTAGTLFDLTKLPLTVWFQATTGICCTTYSGHATQTPENRLMIGSN